MFDTRGGECDIEHLVAITTFVRWPRRSEGTLIREILSSAGLRFLFLLLLPTLRNLSVPHQKIPASPHLQNDHILLPYHQIIKHQNIKIWRRDQNIIHCNQASARLGRGDVALFVQRGQSQVS